MYLCRPVSLIGKAPCAYVSGALTKALFVFLMLSQKFCVVWNARAYYFENLSRLHVIVSRPDEFASRPNKLASRLAKILTLPDVILTSVRDNFSSGRESFSSVRDRNVTLLGAGATKNRYLLIVNRTSRCPAFITNKGIKVVQFNPFQSHGRNKAMFSEYKSSMKRPCLL